MYFDVIQKNYKFPEFYFTSDENIFISGMNYYFIFLFENLKDNLDCIRLSSFVEYCYRPIYNNSYEYITKYNSCFYIIFFIKNYTFNPSFLFQPLVISDKFYLEWRDNWIQKSDYIFSFYSFIKGKYSLIDESIHYYLGLLDYCIYLLNNYIGYYDYGCVQHKRFLLKKYFNPVYFKIDVKERDFADYLKYLFFSNQYKKNHISELIFSGKNYFNYDLVFIRLLFPDYYFDIFDNIILEKDSCSSLYDIIHKQDSYVNYVQMIRSEIEKVYPIKKDINFIS